MAESKKDLKSYTKAEVAAHNSEKSCWVIFNNKVYDVTKFLEDHPGGSEILLDHGGTDGTEDFDDVGHSKDAKQMRDEYIIGLIADKK